MSGHSQPLSIRLLGTISFRQGSGEETTVDAPRLQSLLALLVLHHEGPLSRSQLAFTLWPDVPESGAYNNLRQLLHRLRRLLPDAERFLQTDGQKVWWRGDAPCCVDVALFEEALQHAATAAALRAALSLYTGDLVPGCYDDWIAPHRTRLRQKYLQGLHDLVVRLQQQGDDDEAMAAAQRLVGEEPLEEESHRRLMYLYAHKRDRAGVERSYRRCIETFARELDLPPSPEFEEHYRRLAEVASAAPHCKLPTQPTAFVGRQAELRTLIGRLTDPACRLLSLVGPGGIGKTRLALRLAEQAVVDFLHGVVFVPLVGLDNILHLSAAIADAVGIRFHSNQSTDAQLLHALHEQELLLVLDNYEHLLSDTRLIERIIADAPGVKVLMTTRARLGLRAEWLYLVPGLDLPQENEPWNESGAIWLFTQTARQVEPHFSPDTADQQAMAQICRLVGGMPLGIELAASWVRLLPCAQILDQIRHNLDLLETILHDVPQRHRSLRAIFDNTWARLSPQEQQIFAKLSVFRGPFDLDAAVSVADASLPALASLLDQALLQRAPTGRYQLHELLRQYAAQKLGERPDLQQSTIHLHSTFYATRVRTIAELPTEDELIDQIDLDLDNIMAAWHGALSLAAYENLQPLVAVLYSSYQLRQQQEILLPLFSEAIQILYAKPAPESSLWPRVLGHLLARQAILIYSSSETLVEDTCAIITEAFHLLRSQPPTLELATALSIQGLLASRMYNYADAEVALQEAAGLQRLLEDWRGLHYTITTYARLCTNVGRFADAETLLFEALEVAHTRTHGNLEAQSLLEIGRLFLYCGDHKRAVAYFQGALPIAKESRDEWLAALFKYRMGTLAKDQGDYLLARHYLTEILEKHFKAMKTESVSNIIIIYGQLGRVHHLLDEREDARRCFIQGLRLSTTVFNQEMTLRLLLEIGLFLEAAHPDIAIELYTVARHHAHTVTFVQQAADKQLANLAATLPTHGVQVEAAIARGKELSLPDVVEQLLHLLRTAPLPMAPNFW